MAVGYSDNAGIYAHFAVVRYNGNTTATGIEEAGSGSGLSIYPNPFSFPTTLQADENFKDATLSVYNSYGQQVKEIKNISGRIVFI